MTLWPHFWWHVCFALSLISEFIFKYHIHRPVLSYSKSFDSFIATFLYFCCQNVLGRILLIVFQTVGLKELDEICFRKLIIRSFLIYNLSLDSNKPKPPSLLSGPLRRTANDTSPGRLACTPAPHQRNVQSSFITYLYPNLHCSMISTQKHICGECGKANLPEPHVPRRDVTDDNTHLDVLSHPDDWIFPLFAWTFCLWPTELYHAGLHTASPFLLAILILASTRFFSPMSSQPN